MLVAGCDIAKESPPSLIGPSKLGLSLTLSADPSVLTQDGFSWTRVTVLARDANSVALANVAMRAEILSNTNNGLALADFGQLSTRTIVTGSDGRGSVIYTAPPPPTQSVDTGTIVTILFTPLDPNLRELVLQVRLVPPGVILPPNGTPTAFFTTSQPLEQGTAILFDATLSVDPDGTIVSYAWDFGDGTTGTGVTLHHTYSRGGAVTVILTVTDDRGGSHTAARQISVSSATDPTAILAVSPTSAAVGEQVSVNASGSQAAAGRQIVRYSWTFGDGGSASGALATHTYSAPATYTIVLTVTDDLGNTGTATTSILIGAPLMPSASFVTSPSSPSARQVVQFDASTSTPPTGRVITSYRWAFGDGATASGRVVQHSYDRARTYTAVLTVTDSAGQTDVATRQVTVGGTAATASFTISTSAGSLSITVVVNATASSPSPEATITSYAWNFGDSTALETVSSATHSHTYTSTGSFLVTLTITDSNARTATSTGTVTVN